MRPWSCVIATTMSKAPRRARMKTVSGAKGPLASMPFGARGLHGRADDRSSSSPNSPPSPACGFSPATRDARGRLAPSRSARVRDAQRLQHGVEAQRVDGVRSAMWMVTSTTRSSSLASIMRTGGGRPGGRPAPAASRCGPGRARRRRPAPPCGSGAVTMAGPRRLHPGHGRLDAAMQRRARPADHCPRAAAMRPKGRRPGRQAAPARSSGRQSGGSEARGPGARSRPRHRPIAGHSAAARRITATSPTTTARRPARGEGLHDDLGADAGGVAHRDQQGAPCS
jgi:hypothetical protein